MLSFNLCEVKNNETDAVYSVSRQLLLRTSTESENVPKSEIYLRSKSTENSLHVKCLPVVIFAMKTLKPIYCIFTVKLKLNKFCEISSSSYACLDRLNERFTVFVC